MMNASTIRFVLLCACVSRVTCCPQCVAIPDSKLQRGNKYNGIPLFIEEGVTLTLEHERHANEFTRLLVALASKVYGIATSTLHVYLDKNGSNIGFNKGSSVFCNLRYYIQVHGKKMANAPPGLGQAFSRDAAHFWFVVLAHELAHNAQDGHNALHEEMMEALIAKHLQKFLVFCNGTTLF